MKLFRRVLLILSFIALVFAGLYFYYFYSPRAVMPQLGGSYQRHALDIEQVTRQFAYYQPANLKDGAALVFVLHGSTQSGDQMRASTAYEFDRLADKYGFVVVYPDGYERHWNDCRASADYAANTRNINDLAFFSAMTRYFEETLNINKREVFATGLSNGGHMAYRLALELPGLVKAIAPMAANLPVDSNLDCEKTGKPLSVAIFNGTNDPINPYEGGLVVILGNASRGEVLSSTDTVSYWLGLAGISQQAQRIEYPEVDGNTGTSVHEDRWTADDGLQVRLYTLVGSGHVVPSKIARTPRILGGDAGDISAPEEIVSFFLGLASDQDKLPVAKPQ